MKLNKGPFERMKSGSKVIEIRLYDEKRQNIDIGDTIIFTKLPDKDETLTVKVAGLLRYPKFEDLVRDFDMSMFGYPSDYDKDEFVTAIYEIYTYDQESKYGVLGIKVQK